MSYSLSGLIEINSCHNFKSYIKKIFQFPMLSEEEEFFHASRWTQEKNRESGQILITSHLKLVVKIAMLYKYRGCGLPVMDLISEGTLGLMESLKKFDLAKKCRFATYAIFYIKAKINDFIMNSFSLIKLSTAKATKKLFLKFKEIANSVNDQDLEKIANETGVSIKNVSDMKTRILGREISIDSNVFENQNSSDSGSDTLDKKLKSNLPSPEEITLENEEKKKHFEAIAYACIHFLDDQEKDIIANRILAEKQMTLRELSAKYGISQERIRQKQEIALEKIRKYLNEKKLLPNSSTAGRVLIEQKKK
jgi:RNA polymerase sigma-32 factor